MRKLVCVLIVFMLVTSPVTSLADEFTLHSGVQFGMSREEVIEREREAGFGDVGEEKGTSQECSCLSKHSDRLVSLNGRIAGVNGANITYHFLNSGELDAAVYLLTCGPSGRAYDSIREVLIEKYGNPITETSEVWHAYLDVCVYALFDYWIQLGTASMPTAVDYYYNDTWLVPLDDESYVLISGVEARMQAYGLATNYSTCVGYQRFTKAEIEEVLEQLEEDYNAYNSQLQDDL